MGQVVARDQTDRRADRSRSGLLWLMVVALPLLSICALEGIVRQGWAARLAERYEGTLHSGLQPNYGVDPRGMVFAPLDPQVVDEVVRDQRAPEEGGAKPTPVARLETPPTQPTGTLGVTVTLPAFQTPGQGTPPVTSTRPARTATRATRTLPTVLLTPTPAVPTTGVPLATPTPTVRVPTATPTPTHTLAATQTPTPGSIPTARPVRTPTPGAGTTPLPTVPPSQTPTPAPSPTPAPTSTPRTPTRTISIPDITLTPSPVYTPTEPPGATPTPSPVYTPTEPPGATPTPVPTTQIWEPTPTGTRTATPTWPYTGTPTLTLTLTPSPMGTPTIMPPTPTRTPIPTPPPNALNLSYSCKVAWPGVVYPGKGADPIMRR